MKIANVIYEKELVNHIKSEYINYFNEPVEYNKLNELFQHENYSHLMPPQSYELLPTLYGGWSFMKICNPNNEIIKNANILHKKIVSNELYWEYSFEESISSHTIGVNSFVEIAPELFFQSKYSYINLDPMFFQIIDIESLMDVIPKKIDMLYNFKNEMLYILSNNKIVGINLKIYKTYNFDIVEIFTKINERTEASYIDIEGLLYQQQYKIFPNFPYLKRYLIVMLSN